MVIEIAKNKKLRSAQWKWETPLSEGEKMFEGGLEGEIRG